VYHVLNRSVGRMHMFRKAADFADFERMMVEAQQREPIRILAYCILANHWPFIVWPERDGQPSPSFRWLAEFG
jgi:putative transposase